MPAARLGCSAAHILAVPGRAARLCRHVHDLRSVSGWGLNQLPDFSVPDEIGGRAKEFFFGERYQLHASEVPRGGAEHVRL